VYTLDTNAILYYLKDDADAVSVLRGVFAENVPVYVSAVTELELLAYSGLSPEEESLIEELLATISVIPVDSRIARLAALVRRHYRLKVPDSVIAATAMFTGSRLVTRNTRDFRKISSLALFKI
jgi:predicted nucleic acid-binding protein